MITWVAFVVLSGQSLTTGWPTPAATDPEQQKVSVEATANPDKKSNPAAIKLGLDHGDYQVRSMTGVMANAYVYVPSSSQLLFHDEAKCQRAADALRHAGGVASVTCVQTED